MCVGILSLTVKELTYVRFGSLMISSPPEVIFPWPYLDKVTRVLRRRAGAVAGPHVLRVLNEPTAAVVAYAPNKRILSSQKSTEIANEFFEGDNNLPIALTGWDSS